MGVQVGVKGTKALCFYIRVGPWLLILSDCGWAKVERLVQVQQLALSGEQNEQLFMKDH